jgi:hypothetical protein
LTGNEILQNEITGIQTSFYTNFGGGKLKIAGEFPVANCYRCKCITQYTDKKEESVMKPRTSKQGQQPWFGIWLFS